VVSETGNYLVIDSNACGSVNSNSISIVVQPVPSSDFTYSLSGFEVSLNLQDTTLLPDSLHWNFGDGAFSSETNPVHLFENSGNFNICLNTILGACSSQTCKPVQISITGFLSKSQSGIRVIPNPGKGTFRLISDAGMLTSIRIFDLHGKLVFSSPQQDSQSQMLLNLTNLPSGFYTVEAKTISASQTIRLLKE
jgi:hypothetical protein